MYDIIVIRDPDVSNDIRVFGDDGNVVTLDVDLGAADLNSMEEWVDWLETMHHHVQRCRYLAAVELILDVVATQAEKFGHDAPSWAKPASTLDEAMDKDPFRHDAGMQLIRDTLKDRGFNEVEERMLLATSEENPLGVAVDFWAQFFGPMMDRVEEMLFTYEEIEEVNNS